MSPGSLGSRLPDPYRRECAARRTTLRAAPPRPAEFGPCFRSGGPSDHPSRRRAGRSRRQRAGSPSEGAATHAADVGLEGRVGGDECQALDQRGRGDQAVEGVCMVERKSREGLDMVRFEGEQVDVNRRKLGGEDCRERCGERRVIGIRAGFRFSICKTRKPALTPRSPSAKRLGLECTTRPRGRLKKQS